MIECTNVTIREMLPDLLHDSLVGINRARVEAHVSECSECAAELDLLRAVRDTLATGPALVSVERISGALLSDERESWLNVGRWRAAASIAILLAGSAALAIHLDSRSGNEGRESQSVGSVQPIVVQPAPSESGSKIVSRKTAESSSAQSSHRPGGITMGLDVRHLSKEGLAKLLSDLEKVKARPSSDPEPVYALMGGN
jgi:hypothetical protein